ncbi:unnamed protein product [Meloidogyne enterolobii]|uniref:Uncharacterized protein n=1 Tax=Meloidogyne enterolobii TaxID=390850 RepID=A0ACB1AEF4_MELEN
MVKEKRKEQAFSYKTICGGLEIVNPLPGYPQPSVYKKLLGSRLSAKCADWEAKVFFKLVVEGLGSRAVRNCGFWFFGLADCGLDNLRSKVRKFF